MNIPPSSNQMILVLLKESIKKVLFTIKKKLTRDMKPSGPISEISSWSNTSKEENSPH